MWARKWIALVFLAVWLLPASTAFSQEPDGYRLPPEKYEKAIRYARVRYTLYFISTAGGLLLLWLSLRTGISVRLRDLAERLSRRRFIQAVFYVSLLITLLSVVELPLDMYRHHLAVYYDQSVQTWTSWFWDWVKQLWILCVMGIIALSILYGIIRRSPGLWWFYFWLISIPLVVLMVFLAPLLIEPLFFRFKPLSPSHPDLARQLQRVVQRGGLDIPEERMFEMIASEKYNSINAYVTGIGASKRVVVWDTTLQKTTISETMFVFGHEMGHYILGHIPKSIAFSGVLILIFLFAGSRLMHRLVERYGFHWGLRGVDDWASVPVFLLLASIGSFLFMPVVNGYSRNQEHQADIYGLEIIHDIVPDSGKVAAGAFQVLGEVNLSDPDPPAFIRFWLYSHPSINERILFAQTYDPWNQGKATRYIP